MKLTCERCRAQYNIDDAKIPPSGFQMTCPACSHVMKIASGGSSSVASAAPSSPPTSSGGPREIALSSLGDEDESTVSETPLARAAPSVDDGSPLELADMDFADLSPSAPRAPASRASAPHAPAKDLELLDPPPPPAIEEADLPTPAVRAKRPAATVAQEIVDLPAPRTPPAAHGAPRSDSGPDLPAPKMIRPPTVSTPGAGTVDLPTPRVPPKPAVSDLPRPKPPATPAASKPPATPAASKPPATPAASKPPAAPIALAPPSIAPEPAAGDFAIPLDLDAPDVDDVPSDASATDLPQPQLEVTGGVQPRDDESIGGVAPRVDESAFGVTPKRSALDVAPTKVARGAAPDVDVPPGEATPVKKAAAADADDEEDKPRSRRVIYIAAGVVVLAAAGGAAFMMGVFGDGGAAKREAAAKMIVAQKAIVGDVPAPLRKSISDLKPYSDVEKPNEDAIAVEAELHLSLARLGVAGELTAAKTLLERPVKGAPSADRTRATALRSALGGDVQTARHALNEMVGANPKDALSLSALGWTELAAHDLDTAAKVFARAATAEPAGALYSYELGLAKERLGDDAAAKDAYNKAIGASPDHARARIGLLRIDARAGDAAAATKLEAFLGEHAATLQPRERAELMVTLGQIALANARWSEAEERFKKALAIEPDAGVSFVAYDAKLGLARARVEAGHSSEAVDDLRKLMLTDLRGVDARLLLAQALIDTQKSGEAEPLLGAVEKLRPNEPRLPYLRARLLLAQATPSAQDREQAMTLLKQAVAADPHLVTAWADLARLQSESGHAADAVVTLGKAADALAGDARGAAAIGAAYLTIGRPADAEARFRAVLAGDVGKPPVPEHLPIALGLGEALEAQGKLDAAAQAYADAQALAPKSALLTQRRAHLAEKMNKLDDARKLYEEALTLSPPTVALRLAAASLAITQNRLDDARQLAEAAIKDDDRSPQASVLLARIELASGHSDEAVGLARRAVMLGNAAEAHLVLAQVLEQTNKLDDALAEYKLAEHAPVLEAATLGHARVLVHNGATKDALVELEPLAKSGGVRGEATALMADCYADLQERDKALHAYEEAVKLAPSADLSFKLGRALLDASHREAGIAAIERAIKLADPKVAWMADAYLLLGDGHRGHENDLAIRSYTKYLQIASPTAPMRAEAANQIRLLGGTPPSP